MQLSFSNLHSTNGFVFASTPGLHILLQNDHVSVQPLMQCMFGLFLFIHAIRNISSVHEIMKT